MGETDEANIRDETSEIGIQGETSEANVRDEISEADISAETGDTGRKFMWRVVHMKKYLMCFAAAAATMLFVSTAYGLGNVSTDRTDYQPGQYLLVSFDGVTAQDVENQAWVTISEAQAEPENYGEWEYLPEGSGRLCLEVPDTVGNYELRVYLANRAIEENLVRERSIPITVSGSRPDDETVVYPTVNDFDWDLLEFTPSSRSWTGTYETNFKTLYLLQSGDTLTGSYPEWDDGRVDGFTVDGIFYGYWYESPSYAPPTDAGQLVAALYPDGQGFKGWWRYGNSGSWKDWSAGSFNALEASDLTVDTVYTADANHLIPDDLRGTDLTEGMTIAEFAALSVRVYEEITGKEAEPVATPYTQVAEHPFQSEIEKAYGLGILKNIKADSFRPDEGFSRQLLAVMFCNLIKVCEYEDCTFDTIGSYTLEYTASQPFADEADIDPLAINSAYYLTSNGLMDAEADGRFDPAGKVMREQAVIMAYKFFETVNPGVG